jgi:hypothetical protein
MEALDPTGIASLRTLHAPASTSTTAREWSVSAVTRSDRYSRFNRSRKARTDGSYAGGRAPEAAGSRSSPSSTMPTWQGASCCISPVRPCPSVCRRPLQWRACPYRIVPDQGHQFLQVRLPDSKGGLNSLPAEAADDPGKR